MVETNARILAPGQSIAVPVRTVRVHGTTNTPELREKVCYRLRQEAGLIAVPCQERRGLLLVATDRPILQRRLHVDEWELTLTDADEAKVLTLDTLEGRQLLPELVERMVTAAIEQRGEWWTFDSLRYWYEKKPFQTEEGIEAYRRYAVSVFHIEGIGVGVAVDVETAFFTRETIAYFFDRSVDRGERERRQDRFRRLARRQSGQQGTMLYDNGIKQLKCYFEQVPGDKTCGNTRPRRIKGKEYRSLVEYYQKINPDLQIRPDSLVAFVSFPGLDHPQPVSADCLRIRVMNEVLPLSLINVDKIAPHMRKAMVESFWKKLGDIRFLQIQADSLLTQEREILAVDRPAIHHKEMAIASVRSMETNGFHRHRNGAHTEGRESTRLAASHAPRFSTAEQEISPFVEDRQEVFRVLTDVSAGEFLPGFWQPEVDRVRGIAFPALHFGSDYVLEPPSKPSGASYKDHFKQRLELLGDVGSYHFPPLMGRLLVCPYPDHANICHAAEEMMGGLCDRLNVLTGKPFDYRLLPYDTLENAVSELRQEKAPGTAIFVLNDEAEAYAEVAIGLPDWKVKRITQDTLRKQHRNLILGARSSKNGEPDKARGQRFWDSFLRMTTLDILQVMDGIPYRLDRAGNFEAQLVIDVSYDRRYYALSLLVAREKEKRPQFNMITDAWQKADTKHEAINGRILGDDIIKFVSQWIIPGKDAPLASLLVPRDGKLVGDERAAIDRAVTELKKRGSLTPDARVEVVELHKATEMHLRLWDVDEKSIVTNVLEGTAVRLSSTVEVLTTTGAGTLTQGTAEPLLIVAPEGCTCIGEATDALSAAAHLNWSSPSVAQRLPLPFKRTDEVLKARGEQEIRRIR